MQDSTSLTITNTQKGIIHLAQEAIILSRRLGFGQKPGPKVVAELISNRSQAHDLLNNSVLFCWECDPD